MHAQAGPAEHPTTPPQGPLHNPERYFAVHDLLNSMTRNTGLGNVPKKQ